MTETTAPVAAGEERPSLRQYVIRALMPIVLVAMALGFAAVEPRILSPGNLVNILSQSSYLAIFATAQMVVILTRGFDLSLGMCVSGVSVLTALIMTSTLGKDPATLSLAMGLAVLAGLGFGAAVGLVNGFSIAVLRVNPFIATLGTMTVYRGVALLVTDGLPVPSFRTAGESAPLPQGLIWIGAGEVIGIPVSALVALICGAAAWYVLRYTALGRSIFAIGGNREAARVSGINIDRAKIAAYTISGLMAAIAGLVLTGRLNSANALMAEGEELRSIASVVIGGTNLFGGEGGVIGSLIGALIIGVLGNGLNLLDVSPFWQRVAQGLVIILVVIFDQWRRRRAGR